MKRFLFSLALAGPALAQPLPPDEEARRDALARYGVGLLRTRDDQIATAAKQFEVAAKQTPDAPAPWKELAKLYVELGRDPAAARAGEKALALDPHDLDTAKLLGKLYADAKRPADATRVLKLAAASKHLTEPTAKLLVLRDLAKAADTADDPAAATARTDALGVLKEHRLKLLHPDLFTAAELDRERAKLYEGLGNASRRAKQYAAAVAAFEAARDLWADPKGANDPAGVARLHWNLCEVRRAEGENAKALAELRKYLAFKPAAFVPYERFAELLKATGGDARKELLAAADANPKNPAPKWLAAAAVMALNRADADAEFRTLAGGVGSPDGFRVLATAYRDADRPAPLLDLLDKLFKAARPPETDEPVKDPPDANAEAVARARLLADAVRGLNPSFTKKLLAQVNSERAATRHYDTLELLLGMADRDGGLPTVADALKAAATARPKEYQLKGLRVDALHRLRRWTELANEADELSKSDPGRFYPSIVVQAAVAKAELGKREAALAAFTQHKDLGETPYVQTMRVRVFNILADHKTALAECEKALAGDRLSASETNMLFRAKAGTLDLLGKHAEAEAIWREMLAADPDDVGALNNLGYELADQNRKLEEAETLLRRAVELDAWERTKRGDPQATSGGYADSLGWALFRRGKLTEARELLERAVSGADGIGSGVEWDHLGDVAFRQKDTKRAKEAWTKAAELLAGGHEGKLKGRLDEVREKLKVVE